MELKNELKTLLKNIKKQGKENIIAAVILKLLLGIGFLPCCGFYGLIA